VVPLGSPSEGFLAATFGPTRDEAYPEVVEELRADFATDGAHALGFGLSPDGQAWALLVRLPAA
jgi:hypothetical protein